MQAGGHRFDPGHVHQYPFRSGFFQGLVELIDSPARLILPFPYPLESKKATPSKRLETPGLGVGAMISLIPVTTVTTAWTIAKTAGEISRKLYEFGKSLKDRDAKRQVDEITDELRELKHQASNLEDENRELREKLRFKGDDYEFRTPFWYHKANPERALCAKCFAKEIAAPMGEPGQGCSNSHRRCLVCGENVQVVERIRPSGLPPRVGRAGY